jgi:glycosyltransferase involved in cell wall biosynthesis
MKFVFTSYNSSPEYDHPCTWLKRIRGYTGILENLSRSHTVIGIERINYEGGYGQNGVHYYFIRLRKKVVRFPFRLHRLVKKIKPDVVFINGFIFPLQVIQLRLWLGRSVRIIILHRAEKPFNGVKKYLQKLADKCVDAYLFTSAEFGDHWLRNGNIGDPEKIHEVIQASSFFYPADRSAARSALQVTGSPVFLWVGRLDANKDPFTVIKAFARFLLIQPLAKLYMIYQEEELLQDVVGLVTSFDNAPAAIQLVGKAAPEELQNWYNSADFIISSSHYEGSGVAVSEAMSCGCIPVVTNIISFRRMTGPGKCGLLYRPGNENELLSALVKTLQLDLEAERHKVLEQFRNELSFEAIGRKIQEVVASL